MTIRNISLTLVAYSYTAAFPLGSIGPHIHVHVHVHACVEFLIVLSSTVDTYLTSKLF